MKDETRTVAIAAEPAPRAPAYLRLYRQLRGDIEAGNYSPGSKMPSKRAAAEQAGVSVVTVEHAYAMLCDEGYLETRPRSGTYVIFRPANGYFGGEEAAPPDVTGGGAAPAGSFPLSLLTKTMRRVTAEAGERLLQKPPNAGCPALREALRHYLARSRGVRVETRQIIIGSGAEYLYGLIAQLLGNHRLYAIESPSYRPIEQVYRALGVPLCLLPLGRHGLQSGPLWQTAATVLHVTPCRSYPSGVTATASKRHEYLRWAGEGDRYVIEDDFESEFSLGVKPEETLFARTTRDNVLYVNTFTKTVSPALRVGYMVLPRRLVDPFEQTLGFYSCTVPTFEQLVLAELIAGGDFERTIRRVRRQRREGQ